MRDTDPTPRRVVAAFALAGLITLLSIIAMTNALRLPLPAPEATEATEATAEQIDPLRDTVICPLAAGREGVERPETPTGPALPEPLTSGQLLDCPGTWDGRLVQISGEVVGTPLDRGHGTWVQVNDDAYALDVGPLPLHRDFQGGNGGMGALLSRGQAATIEFTGRTGVRGDIIEIVGIFHRVFPRTGEVAVIEAEDVRVVRRGFTFDRPSSGARPVVAGLAALAAIAAVIAERRIRARR